jgi:CubicO group peptidase (beta-lactamase class C family)
MRFRTLAALALSLVGVPLHRAVAQAAAPAPAPLVARLDSLTRDWVATTPAASASVGVVRGRDTLLLAAVGESDREAHRAATPAPVSRIGSVTKQFTAAAVMQLVERTRIALADPITKYLPEFPQWRAVTVRQLLNHTSGIHSYTASDAWRRTWADDLTPARVVSFVEKDTFDFAPGTRFRYNNTGYVLLGMILERVTGKPYAEYVRTTFFAPLGMRTASYCPSRTTDPTHAVGYDLRMGGARAPYLSMTHPFSAGARCMSVPDYLRWQAALTGGRVVRPASYALMSASDTLANGEKTGYGFGLAPSMTGTHREVKHGGAVHGFNTEQSWFPDDSLRVVVFTNTGGSDPARLAGKLAAAVLGLPIAAAAPTARALPAAERARYVGTYDLRLPNDRTLPLRIFQEGDALMSQAEGPGQGKFPMLYKGNDTFGAEFDPTLKLTILFENGKAVRARLVQRGNTMEGPREP